MPQAPNETSEGISGGLVLLFAAGLFGWGVYSLIVGRIYMHYGYYTRKEHPVLFYLYTLTFIVLPMLLMIATMYALNH